ncbi:hypothetical protein AGR7B_Cc170014 [Agrobacterium deltaense RV3]|nr:hypothetical protein [Agrobacterium deltaense]CUX16997.1 hypothetical protein AGR7B_Cc170014 [Agrobacterium deltaense RV3]
MPVSVLLHLAVVALFFFELPERIAEPQEPESISVDLVPPPEEKKAEEAPPPGEENAKEEKPQPPPPPAPPAEEAKPLPPPQATLPAIAMRPEEAQADPEDKPGKTEEAEKTEPSAEPASQPEKTAEEKPAAPAANSDLQASAAQGEIAVSPVKEEAQPDQPPVPQAKPAEEKPAEVTEKKPAKLPAAKKPPVFVDAVTGPETPDVWRSATASPCRSALQHRSPGPDSGRGICRQGHDPLFGHGRQDFR